VAGHRERTRRGRGLTARHSTSAASTRHSGVDTQYESRSSVAAAPPTHSLDGVKRRRAKLGTAPPKSGPGWSCVCGCGGMAAWTGPRHDMTPSNKFFTSTMTGLGSLGSALDSAPRGGGGGVTFSESIDDRFPPLSASRDLGRSASRHDHPAGVTRTPRYRVACAVACGSAAPLR
jgi:hypothetical protein